MFYWQFALVLKHCAISFTPFSSGGTHVTVTGRNFGGVAEPIMVVVITVDDEISTLYQVRFKVQNSLKMVIMLCTCEILWIMVIPKYVIH